MRLLRECGSFWHLHYFSLLPIFKEGSLDPCVSYQRGHTCAGRRSEVWGVGEMGGNEADFNFITSQLVIMLNREMRSIDFSRVRFDRNQEKLLVCSASTKFLQAAHENNEQQLEKTQVFIPHFQLEQEIKHYEWRAKTEFPIVKVVDFRAGTPIEGKTPVEVSCESYPVRLMQLKDMPLFKILYLLKESVIGCERLFDRFGPFMMTARMVAVSQQNRCKVWLNENFASNQFRSQQIDEKYFLLSLYRLFETRSNKLKNTILFFQELAQCRTFCQALTFIENYARENKISIPTACKLTQKEMSLVNNQSGSGFDPSLTMSRAPKFLGAGLRASLKPDSKHLILDMAHSISIKEEDEHRDNNMKTSGDTAADIYGSKTMSYNEKEKIEESLIFGNKEGREGSKSGMPMKINTENHLGFHRKFSCHNEDVHCFTPTYSSRKEWNEEPHFLSNSKWDDKGFYGEQSDDQEVPKINITNVFSKNNWEKTLNGLFANESEEMKKSFHHGKEKRKTQHSTNKLELLGKFGKNIHESFINDYHECDEDGRPYTSQY